MSDDPDAHTPTGRRAAARRLRQPAHARCGAADGDTNRNRDGAADGYGNTVAHCITNASAYTHPDGPIANSHTNSYPHPITDSAADRAARPAPHQCRPAGSFYP
jgi:hypothetical protein